MKKMKINQVKSGMVLGKAIYNEDETIELLAKNTKLNERHIGLLENSGISEVYILEESEKESQVVKNVSFEKFDSIVTNVVNQNMQINKLTGEGNKPIDERNLEAINETKDIFEKIVQKESVDIESVEKNVHNMLPDMIRNNDVLMRLDQLKKYDNYTFEHSLRVSILAANIGKWFGYPKDIVEELAQAGLLFDIGKMKLPESILKNKHNLTEAQMEVYQRHPQLGYNVLLKTPGTSQGVKYTCLQHHENVDGTGYPLRLRSGQIHQYAKIISVCHTFDELISEKPYGKGLSKIQAYEYLNWNTNTKFDATVVYVFLKKISEYMIAKKVILNNGKKGKIIYNDTNFPTKPTVRLNSGQIVDLSKTKNLKITKIIER
ncbi:MAG: HD-GYP domain-containing protein [Bacillota bacterium]